MQKACDSHPAQILKLLALTALLVFIPGCSNRHIIYHQTALSRDYTYVTFSRDTAPYVHQGQVGGEHSTFIKVLGFQGDCFTIEMQQKGDAGFTVYTEGGQIEQGGSLYRVSVNALSDLFTIEISALNYGDYALTITKGHD